MAQRYVPDEQVEPHLAQHLSAIRPAQTDQSLRARRATILRVANNIGRPVAEATFDDLVEWQEIQRHRIKRSSMAAALTHLKCYLEWVVKQNIRADNPAADLVRPRHAFTKNPHPIGESELQAALAGVDHLLHAWISLGAFCGLRCMEIAKVDREDIIPPQGKTKPRLLVEGKGGRVRKVLLPEGLYLELNSDYFPLRGPLWPGNDASRVSRVINRHLHQLGFVDTAHGLRHRYGTELYRETKDVMAVKTALGHENLETTMCYVRAVDSDQTGDAVEAISRPRVAA